jgi:hypothetical protein
MLECQIIKFFVKSFYKNLELKNQIIILRTLINLLVDIENTIYFFEFDLWKPIIKSIDET